MMNPQDVHGPRTHWKLDRVIFNAGSWSLAQGKWDGEDALGIRWNGESDNDADIGFPKSRSGPLWFIVPDPLKPLILAAVNLKER